MGTRRLIRLPGRPGAFVRNVDPALLQRVLVQLLTTSPDQARLLIRRDRLRRLA
jgi:hypothetical protein